MEYTNTFEDEARRHWYELLCYYHATTEKYDRTLTEMRSPYDPTEAWICIPYIRQLSNTFAKRCWNNVLNMARELNIPSYIIKENRFGHKYHYSAQRWIDEYEMIQKEKWNIERSNNEEDLCSLWNT